MKKYLILFAAFIFITTFNTQAQQSLRVIQSQDTLREYALGAVVGGSRYVYSKSIDWKWSGSVTYTNVTGNGAENVLKKLFEADLVFRMVNPDDTVNGYVYLYDKDDNMLFFGYTEYVPSKKTKPIYNIWMQDIPVLENVEEAEILVLNEDGQTVSTIRLNVNHLGQLMFQPWMASRSNGLLAVKFKNGSLMTYRLSDPNEGMSPGIISENELSFQIDGHYIISPSPKDVLLVDIIEVYTLPTVFIHVGTNQSVKIDVRGLVQDNGQQYFERPMSLSFTQVDGPWAGSGVMLQDQPTIIGMPQPGEYRLRFQWQNFGKPGKFYMASTAPIPVGKPDVTTPITPTTAPVVEASTASVTDQ